MNPEKHLAEHERFEVLCILSATGELTAMEADELQNHIDSCSDCKRALLDFRQFANGGMAYLASEFANPAEDCAAPWAQEDAKHELFKRLQKMEVNGALPPAARQLSRAGWMRFAAAAAIAAGILLVLAYNRGELKGRHEAATALAENHALQDRLQSLTSEKDEIDHTLQGQASNLAELTAKTRQQREDLVKLRDLDKARQSQIDSLLAENHDQSTVVLSLSAQRDSLTHNLHDAEKSLRDSEAELASERAQRQRDLLRSASLETEIRTLSARVKDGDATVTEQQNFLASDRDIRELMGARNLYIADVFDVDGSGTSKPFGRVFYTKNKSLLFYAFDLDQQPHVRNSSIFQAWGRHGVSDKLPLNMGIFYLDNQANRRWILKFDDPEKLAQIDAVFVTVEPHGGSTKPSGKQLLFASLRSMANHP